MLMLTNQSLINYFIEYTPVNDLQSSLKTWTNNLSIIEQNIDMFKFGLMVRNVSIDDINLAMKVLLDTLPTNNPFAIYEALQSHNALSMGIDNLFYFFSIIAIRHDYEKISEIIIAAHNLSKLDANEFMFENEYHEMGEKHFNDDECNYNQSSYYIDWDFYCRDIFNYQSIYIDLSKTIGYCGYVYAVPQ